MENIFPIEKTHKQEKISFLNQNPLSIWLCGLSGSGKSTIAYGLEKKLLENGYLSIILDGDNIRNGLNKNLSFHIEDRIENIRRIAELNNILIENGIIVINSFLTPTNEIRLIYKNIIDVNDIIEFFINTPLEVCIERDPKGLYEKALKGEIKNFTGISSKFEEPIDSINIDTSLSEEKTVEKIYQKIINKIKI